MAVMFPSITEAIAEVYAESNLKPSSVNVCITPLREIVSSLNLACVELPSLSSRAASEYLLRRGVTVNLTDEINEIPLAGYLYVSMNFGCIFVHQADRVTRRRFSVAHELGHYILHLRPVLEALKRQGESLTISITDTPSDTEADDADDPSSPDQAYSGRISSSDQAVGIEWLPSLEQMEKEADAFAAALLMPADVVQKLATSLALPPEDLAWKLATELLVSRSTMTRRLQELQLFDSAPAAI